MPVDRVVELAGLRVIRDVAPDEVDLFRAACRQATSRRSQRGLGFGELVEAGEFLSPFVLSGLSAAVGFIGQQVTDAIGSEMQARVKSRKRFRFRATASSPIISPNDFRRCAIKEYDRTVEVVTATLVLDGRTREQADELARKCVQAIIESPLPDEPEK